MPPRGMQCVAARIYDRHYRQTKQLTVRRTTLSARRAPTSPWAGTHSGILLAASLDWRCNDKWSERTRLTYRWSDVPPTPTATSAVSSKARML
jgi:hypothetical protein